MTEAEASLYEAPFRHVISKVRADRAEKREQRAHIFWWMLQRPRPEMRHALVGLDRFIATPRVAKHRIFVWAAAQVLPDSRLNVIARDDDLIMGILHSRIHEEWSLALCSIHGDGSEGGRPTYNASIFDCFPFPEELTPDIPTGAYADDPRAQRIATAARRLNELREAWLNPPDLVVRVPEVTSRVVV
jgi:hypothetical protein